MADYEERFVSFVGGQNQAVHPSLVATGEYQSGVNISSRGGMAKTRPMWVEHPTAIAAGKFQGAEVYHLSGNDRFVFAVAGKIYTLKLEDDSLTDHGLQFDPAAMDRFYFCQADKFMVVQDGDPSTDHASANWPVILDNLALIDQSALSDWQRLPKGAAMAYGHGRLFVAVNYVFAPITHAVSINMGRVGFVAGDIIKAYDREAVLKFTSEEYLNEGGRFPLPMEAGQITAMGFQKNIPSGTGEGPLVVSAEHGMSAYQVNAPRAEWKNIDLGQVLFLQNGIGAASANAFVSRNADIFYRSFDGIRTLSSTVTESQAPGYSNDPISGETKDFLASDDDDTVRLSSAAISNHRLLLTCEPDKANKTFKGLISLDMEPVSSIKNRAAPLYDGVWTGFHVHQVLSAVYNGKHTFFAFALDQAGNNRLFYLVEDGYEDEGSARPPCRIYTGEKFFDDPWAMKKLKYIEYWFEDIIGQVDFTAYYQIDGYPFWCPMQSGTVYADPTGSPRREVKMRVSPLGDETDSLLSSRLDSGYALNFCFEWTGHARLTKALAVAMVGDNGEHQVIENIDATSRKLVASGSQSALDNFAYRVV